MLATLALPAATVAQDPTPLFGVRSLALSPDGKRLAFTYFGDIWVVSSAGGTAIPLTSNTELDENPVWSPDGRTIAFSSNRNGNNDIYLVSADGGTPRRLTWYSGNDVPSDWSPDGSKILFSGSRDGRWNGVFTLDVKSGRFTQHFTDPMPIGDPKFSPDGQRIAYRRFGFPWVRARYQGSAAAALYVYDLNAKTRKPLRNNELQHLWTHWTDAGLHTVTMTEKVPSSSYVNKPIGRVTYSVSGTPNVYKVNENGGVAARTKYSGDGVRFLTVARKAPVIAYERDGEVYVGSGNATDEKITINANLDDKTVTEERQVFTSGASEMATSPDGKSVIFTARNDLWTVPVKKGKGPNKDDATRLTTWEGFDTQATWTPDGKAIFFVSDRDGTERLYRMDLATKAVTAITSLDADVSSLTITPDKKSLSFWMTGKLGGLYVVPVDGGEAKRILTRTGNSAFSYRWSPDGRWVAYAEVLDGSGYYYWESARNINILEVATGEIRNVTKLNAQHYVPTWSADGKYLYFGSNRQGSGLFVLPLQPEDLRSNEIELEYKKPSGPVKVEIDFNQIEQRIRRFSGVDVSGNMASDPETGHLYVQSGRSIVRFDYSGEGQRTIVGESDGFSVTPDGKQLEYLRSGTLNLVNLRAPNFPSETIAFRADWTRDVQRERRAAFQQFWREYNRGFYDANFHGRDWVALRKKYERYLPSVGTRQDMATLLNMMVGELEASHAEVSPAFGGNPSASSANLGVLFDYAWTGAGIKVLDVPTRLPASFSKTKLNKGDVITKINGTEVSANEALYRDVLNEQSGRELVLTVRNPSGEIREVKYRALSGGEVAGTIFQNLLDWRRQYVEEKSGGKVSYVHIAGMSQPELDRFQQQVWQVMQKKQALVIDVRNNGGGNTSDRIIDILERRPNAYYQIRDEAPIVGPGQTGDFPMVVMCNQTSYSNAEMFPNSMKSRKLAALVGMPTPGYVIYTYGLQLVDGTQARMPSTGVFRLDGSPLENMGVVPDHVLDFDPDEFLAGKDRQLDKAIEVALQLARR
ncbi:MAG: S41 family peptidase [Fimbriimonadaceae bacterium]|nr:S41 family peptidase [Fimbriimonadaceae bacterium]